MKLPVPNIHTYSISDITDYAGQTTPENDLFVLRKQEIPSHERMYRPARSLHFTLFLHLYGKLEVKVNLVTYKITQPSLVIILPGVVREKVTESDDCDAITVGFSKDFLGKAQINRKHIDAFEFFSLNSHPVFSITEQEKETLVDFMLTLKKIYSDQEHVYREEMMYHGFNILMLEMAAIARKYRNPGEQKLTRKEGLLLSFIKLLAAHFREERSVQYYADALHITPKHLTKSIKEITEKTTGELIDEMVITEAKILLGDMSYSVAQVADLLHFSDQFFFSKFFKNHTGVSPKEYKSLN